MNSYIPIGIFADKDIIFSFIIQSEKATISSASLYKVSL